MKVKPYMVVGVNNHPSYTSHTLEQRFAGVTTHDDEASAKEAAARIAGTPMNGQPNNGAVIFKAVSMTKVPVPDVEFVDLTAK